MKTIFFILSFFSFNSIAHAQDAMNYLRSRGGEKIALIAHPTNTFDGSSSSLKYDDNYYYLDLYYTNKTIGNSPLHTQIRLGKSNGILTFSSVEATYDNDLVRPFFALLTGMALMLEVAKRNNPESYNEQLQDLRNYLGIEPNKWNGADWALFLVNLDYGCRCVVNDN